MKKKIAVFANGWSDEYIRTILEGIRECAHVNNVDVFVFLEFTSGDTEVENIGEMNIVKLPDLKNFDGVMLLANTFNRLEVLRYLQEEIKRADIPAMSLEYEVEDIDFLGTENYPGMYDLAVHMIECHGARDILFIGGLQGNQESEIRGQALKDAMSEHGLTLEEKDIIYGDFSDLRVQEVLEEWMDKNRRLPDAIVCANDVMAMGTCLWLQKHGYSVPEDVRVTGYDCIESARFCFPSITTVAREGKLSGYKGLQHLLDRISGKDVPAKMAMPSKFVVGESCGCLNSKNGAAKPMISHSTYGKKRDNMDFDSHNRALYRWIRGINTEEELYQAMDNYFANSHIYEGDNFILCLDQEFFFTIKSGEKLSVDGYSETMQTLCYIKDNVLLPRTVFDTTQLVPDYDGESSKEHIYIFAPLHSEEKCMGYAVFRDKDDVIDNYMLFTWTRHMDQCLEQARQNIRLEELNRKLMELSVRDTLTGVYNRMGYERYALPYLEQCRQQGIYGVMVFADINHMKLINDRHGHLQGDVAICTVASVLQKAMPAGSVVVRYGGDEFLAAGACRTQEQVWQLEQKINEVLRQEIEKRKIDFDLSVSVGVVLVEDSQTLSMEECFKKADASMYQMKKQQHERQKAL
ncbi:MAG: GGDEF domain-containing protein [Roseburia sp.]|nr:GGDEF domain-containing protein [Roseburia sp.]